MEIKALALTLPNPDKFLVLTHKRSNTASPLVWEETYRDQLFEMQRFVREVAKGRHLDSLNEEQKEALLVPGMNPKDAEESIRCVWVDAERYGKKLKFLDKERDNVSIGGLAGYDVEKGFIRYLLVNNGSKFTPTKELMVELDSRFSKGKWLAVSPAGKEVPISRFEPGYRVVDTEGNDVDFDDLSWRKSHMFIGQVTRFGSKALTDEKIVRLVTIPTEARVSIVVSRGKEVLREIPRQWA